MGDVSTTTLPLKVSTTVKNVTRMVATRGEISQLYDAYHARGKDWYYGCVRPNPKSGESRDFYQIIITLIEEKKKKKPTGDVTLTVEEVINRTLEYMVEKNGGSPSATQLEKARDRVFKDIAYDIKPSWQHYFISILPVKADMPCAAHGEECPRRYEKWGGWDDGKWNNALGLGCPYARNPAEWAADVLWT